jgi:hypothetical protein
VIWGAPSCNHVAKTAQGLKDKVLRNKFVLSIESWFFTFFHFFFAHGFAWYHLQCDRYNLNVKFWFFSRNFTRSTMLKFWVKAPVKKKNFSSLMITNMELRFEPCVLKLIWKWGAKEQKKREDHIAFINFGVKKFTVKNTQKKTLMFERYNLLDPMEWGAEIFLRLISNKVTSRSYSYFLKFLYFYFWRN